MPSTANDTPYYCYPSPIPVKCVRLQSPIIAPKAGLYCTPSVQALHNSSSSNYILELLYKLWFFVIHRVGMQLP